MTKDLAGTRIAFLTAPEGVEQVELTEPWEAVREAGGEPVLVSTAPGKIQAFRHLDRGDRFDVDETVDQADPAAFDALVLPGGVANPDFLRTHRDAVRFTRAFFDAGRPVAVICHGPWTLIDAEVVRGRRITSWPSVRTDLVNAGAHWVDEEVVIDATDANMLISSRRPDDLKAFCAAIVDHVRPADQQNTRPAGAGLSDAEAAREVAGQTSADRRAADVFARESGGAAGDTEAARAPADELR
ncbi:MULTISPECIES: type 1 glutamine amidotransferase domain-containing protein [Frankia]|uniref:Intracellular proteinase with glutamine amidotransferase-like domain (Partial match) n=1 Tax=Frankia alni (strain DSM 45986 / CECT 9034 / ACN14a) TaxID=326424 RepID=Q0REY3_FRAAA|nr:MULTISPECIES: type 1 glutamine amidotransferase domain-containing protein [Frankia]CAJ63969.1 putative intracellular proteinase with glutamine amidotransferase-like domain (partial match) [Frankia alni ACN14a]